MHQHRIIEDTVYFWFGSNDTSGSGADGATPVYDVRLAGAAAGAIPVLSGSATLLTHANFPAGAHEIAIAATTGNGFAAGSTYAVFCTLLVDSQNPTGFVGSFSLEPIIADVREWNGTNVATPDTAGYPKVTIKDGSGQGEIALTAGKIDEVSALTGHTVQTGDNYTRLGAPAGASIAADINEIETDTQNIQSRIPAALVGGRMSSDAVAISGSTNAADKLEASAETIVTGAAVTGTLTTTEMTTDLTEATDDHYNGRRIIFTSGQLKDQATSITDYDGATKKITMVAVTSPPANGDTFNIV